MKRLIRKVLRAPITIRNLIVDRVFGPLLLKLNEVEAAPGVRVVGLPTIQRATGSTIRLEKGVALYSRGSSNRLGIFRPSFLTTLNPQAAIHIGPGSQLSGTTICAATRITLGERVLVGANCLLVDTDAHPLSYQARRNHSTSGASSKPIEIGDDVFIGTRAVILKGTRLGQGCVVGAGSVVSGDFPPNSIIVGVPGKVIKTLGEDQT